MSTLKREPILVRTLVLAILAVAAVLLPIDAIDVEAVEGIVFAGLALLTGIDARRVVSPLDT